MTAAELVLVGDLRRALAVVLGQFTECVCAGDFSGAERWASLAFGLVAALEDRQDA